MPHADLFLHLAIIFAFFMAWGVGANDVANAMGTSVGAKAIKFWQALVIAAIFEAAGSLLAGGQVAQTICKKIIDPSSFSSHPEILVLGMMAALLAAGTWLVVASFKGWPVSTTHTIIGAITGFGMIVLGPQHIKWQQMSSIILSWIVTPIISGVIAFLLFRSVQLLIFNSKTPIKNAKRYVPGYIFLVSMVLSLVTVFKGLKHLHLSLNWLEGIALAFAISIVTSCIGYLLLRKIPDTAGNQDLHEEIQQLEKIFGILMIFTACSMAFAHGSNDVANAIGPLAAVEAIVSAHGNVAALSNPMPFWVLILGAGGIVLGLATYGYKVMATIGKKITELTPSRGFAAELATASTVVIASAYGLPISTTQTLVGGVLGVGFARGIGAINLNVVRNIFLSWVITLPAGAGICILYYHLLKLIIT
jgi:inorganic phosphate transporter, PiT family